MSRDSVQRDLILGLTIRDFVLIEELSVALTHGLNVLSGGSGQGKTLMIKALRFALGEGTGGRVAARRLVRPQGVEASVELTLQPGPALRAALGETASPIWLLPGSGWRRKGVGGDRRSIEGRRR